MSEPNVRLSAYPADVTEVSARRGRAPELETMARAAGLELPAFGRVTVGAEQLVLSVRPGRWLWLTQAAAPGAVAAAWQVRCAGLGFVVDLSSGLTALHLAGTATREMLTRRCRLDLDPIEFPAGCAAATVIAQVSVVLCAIPSGFLLLTPSTTAQHFLEWIATAARPFGYRSEPT